MGLAPFRLSVRLKLVLLRLIALAGVVLVIPVVALLVILLSERKHLSAKYQPETEVVLPLLEAEFAIEPIPQDEPHTCGLLAISAVFKAYGQDPEAARLRFHLGTDRAAIFGRGPADSTGTLQPDMARVLNQQGWKVEYLHEPGTASAALAEHLRFGPALALIALEPSNALHWVALDAGPEGKLRVVDSLQAHVQNMAVSEFLSERTLSVLLLTPQAASTSSSASPPHAAGTLELARVGARLQEL